jgi:hypothetical protein
MPKITREMFGTVTGPKATGDYVADIEHLMRPFDKEESVIYLFCKGCGMTFELTEDDANTFMDIEENKSGLYIEAKGCGLCDGDEDDYKIRRIKELLQ